MATEEQLKQIQQPKAIPGFPCPGCHGTVSADHANCPNCGFRIYSPEMITAVSRQVIQRLTGLGTLGVK